MISKGGYDANFVARDNITVIADLIIQILVELIGEVGKARQPLPPGTRKNAAAREHFP
ncbi:MAG: hypothetical protein IPG67_09585 [Acidobacteria bacterium]|nr:hypothetical protein [Acidobacteriota bacterium]